MTAKKSPEDSDNAYYVRLMAIVILILTAVASSAITMVVTGGGSGSSSSAGLSQDDVDRAVADALKNARPAAPNRPSARPSAEDANAAIASNKDALMNVSDLPVPVLGNPEGDITVIEFFDYSCGYCKRVAPVMQQVAESEPDVRIIHRQFPILGPGSAVAAQYASAAYILDPDAYESFHMALMEAPSLSEDAIKKIAADKGYDVGKLSDTINSKEVGQVLQANRSLGQNVGVRGTPAFVVGTQLVPGAVGLETMLAKIAEEREKL